jgi:hypothetical protein
MAPFTGTIDGLRLTNLRRFRLFRLHETLMYLSDARSVSLAMRCPVRLGSCSAGWLLNNGSDAARLAVRSRSFLDLAHRHPLLLSFRRLPRDGSAAAERQRSILAQDAAQERSSVDTREVRIAHSSSRSSSPPAGAVRLAQPKGRCTTGPPLMHDTERARSSQSVQPGIHRP